MSNETRTYVTISRTEHERLQREARNASNLAGQVAAMSRLQEAMDLQNRGYQRQIQNMEAQANSTLRVISGLQTQNTQLRQEIANAVSRQNQQLQAMATRHQQEMATMNREFTRTIGDVRNEFRDTTQLIVREMDRQREDLQNQMHEMERGLQREMSTLQGQIDAVDHTVQAMQKDDATLRSLAQTYSEAANAIIHELQGHRTEQFAPGRLLPLTTIRDHINGDLNSGLHGIGAAARSDARDLLADALNLRRDVFLEEQRWEQQRQLTIQMIDRVEAQIQANREVKPADEPEALDINHWSYGELTRLQDRLNALRKETDNIGLSTQQMEDLQAAAAEISEEISETVYFAIAASRASHDREDIIEGLEREFFDGENGVLLQLTDDSYHGGDERAGIRARLENPLTGLEMAITIQPEIGENGEVGNSFTYDVESDGAHNAAFASSVLNRIVNVLRSRGLECTPPQELPEGDTRCNEAATRFNVEHWRQEEAPALTPSRRTGQSQRNAGQTQGNARRAHNH